MNTNPFASVTKFFNETNNAISSEIDNLDALSAQGVDITSMIEEASIKVAALRKQADDLLEYTYNQEVDNIKNNG